MALKKAWRAVLDFWRKFDRTEEVTERPFMVPQSKLTARIVDMAYEEGIRRLESQVAALARTKQLVQTILGWYVAAGISLVGILVGQIASGGSGFTIIMATYGTVVVAVSAWRFWNGSLFDTVTYEPGVEPAEFLNDEAVDWLNTLPDESWEFYKKHQELVRIQKAIDRNTAQSVRIRRLYRRGVRVTVFGLFGAAILIPFLALVLL